MADEAQKPARDDMAVAVLLNGNAKSVTGDVIRDLRSHLGGSELFVSRSLEHAREIANEIVASGVRTLLIGGGDGTFTFTVSEVISAAEDQGRPLPRFGYLKLGTGNALAHVVGARGQRELSDDVRRLCEQAGDREVRLVEVEGYHAPFCGIGADAWLLADFAEVKHRVRGTALRPLASGLLGYAWASATKFAPRLLLSEAPTCRVINLGGPAQRVGEKGQPLGDVVPTGDPIYDGPARLIGMSTIPYYGFGLRMFPYAQERTDKMSLRIANMGAAALVKNLRSLWRGQFQDPTHIHDFLVDAVRIEIEPKTPLQIGGDVMGPRDSVEARLSDDPIQLVDFYAPPKGNVSASRRSV